MKRAAVLLAVVASAFVVGGGLWQGRTTSAGGPPPISLPPTAVEIAPDVYSIGRAVVDGRVVEGIAYVHRLGGPQATHKGPDKPHGGPNGGGGDGGAGSAEACYSFKGAKWNVAESWTVNPVNAEGLSANDILVRARQAADAWDVEVAAQIFGSSDANGAATGPSASDANTIFFGDFDQAGVIAVTYTWTTIGPPSTRQIVAWDMLLDQVDWDWSLTGEAGDMDLLNILAHEVGHAAGMGHTDSSETCADQTMYPTASTGETKKRDLDLGDKAGIKALYN